MTSINKKKIALKQNLNQKKLRNKAMKLGVTLVSPETVFLSNDTKFGKNVTINPYVVIGKKTKIGNNVEILPFTHIENATLKTNVKVGPFSRIRPGSILFENTKVGNFVEIKKSKIGRNSKVSHLSYIGDTAIGKNSLYSNTYGQQNIAVGFEALSSNPDGDKNTAIGYTALKNFEADAAGNLEPWGLDDPTLKISLNLVGLNPNKPEKDDGSLSWEALRRGVRYLNIETRLGYLTQQKKMLSFVQNNLN